MNRLLPAGLWVKAAVEVDEGVPKLSGDISAARYEMILAGRDVAEFGDTIDLFMRERRANRTAADRPILVEFRKQETGEALHYQYVCTMPSGRSITPEDMISQNRRAYHRPPRLARLALYVDRDGQLLCPISKGVVHRSS
jgi:hypothetical protein